MAKMKTPKLPLQEVAGVIAGSIAANLVSKAVTKAMPESKPTVKALIPLALGIFLATQKNSLVKGAGFGMVAKGGNDLINALLPADSAPVTGMDDIFMSGDDEFIGIPADQSILSLPADQSILSGMMEDGISEDELSIISAMDDEF
jgi:hypothetical protein